MGFWDRIVDQKKSSVSGGGSRTTTTYSNGSSEDKTYSSNGRLADITDHDSKGNSHSHNVGHGIFGPFKGSRK